MSMKTLTKMPKVDWRGNKLTNYHKVKVKGKNDFAYVKGEYLIVEDLKGIGFRDVMYIKIAAIEMLSLNRRGLGADILTITWPMGKYDMKSDTAAKLMDEILDLA